MDGLTSDQQKILEEIETDLAAIAKTMASWTPIFQSISMSQSTIAASGKPTGIVSIPGVPTQKNPPEPMS